MSSQAGLIAQRAAAVGLTEAARDKSKDPETVKFVDFKKVKRRTHAESNIPTMTLEG